MSPLIIEAHGKKYLGEYSVSGPLLTVAFDGASKQEQIEGASVLVVARRMLRELVYDGERRACIAAGEGPRGGGGCEHASNDHDRP
jgi:hypothetical protein